MMSEFSRIIDIDQESYIRMKEIIKIIYMGKSIIIVFLHYENNTTTQ